MDKFLISGPCRIKGQINIQGSKNAALPILASTLLFDNAVVIENLPRGKDFDTMLNLVKPPDLLVYLQSSIPNLVNKIHKRGREYEKTISIEYLSRLNERYEAWITNYDNGKLLKINVDDMDFVENKSDYESILSMIKKEL